MKERSITQLANRWLIRGESQVASTGLALAAIFLGAMAASGWWTLRSERSAAEHARKANAEAIGSMLAAASESMLSVNEVSGVRRLIADAARVHEFSECRIILPNGEVVAAADTSHISLRQLPAAWSGAAPVSVAEADLKNGLTFRFPMEIAGRGSAALEVTAPMPSQPGTYWQTQAGLGIIGAISLLALLATYRRMRSRLGATGSIREALLAWGKGERAMAVLAVGADCGLVGESWNQLLAENEAMRMKLLVGRVQELGHSPANGATDLEGVCDAMWQGLLLVDEQLHIKYANGAAAVLLRAQRQDLTAAEVGRFVDANVLEPIREIVGGTLRRRVNVETKREGDSGTGVLRFSVRPVRRGDTAAAMIIIEDITQQRLAEEARNSFVAQATHELRTPLTNIRLYTESALEDGEHDAVIRAKCLNVINQESRRLERIVGDMLSVSEIEAGTLKLRQGDVRLETLFEELSADYQAQAKEKEIDFKLNLPPKLPVIRGDRDKLTLALHNLIGNALKYTPAKGKVSITVELTKDKLVVDVSDTGIGIKLEEADLIFEKFYRAKDSRIAGITGSGLGLSVAREVIRLHRGDITLRSEINQGSTFTLTVPTLSEAA